MVILVQGQRHHMAVLVQEIWRQVTSNSAWILSLLFQQNGWLLRIEISRCCQAINLFQKIPVLATVDIPAIVQHKVRYTVLFHAGQDKEKKLKRKMAR